MKALTEEQFHTVWTEAVGRKGYNKEMFRNILVALKEKKLINVCNKHFVSNNEVTLKALEDMKLGGTQQYALGNDDAIRKVLRLLNDC